MAKEDVIVVDLDGTLIQSDILWESIFLIARHNFFLLFLVPLWLIKGGKAYLKVKLANVVQPDAATLPYNRALLEKLALLKKEGKRLLLASASEQRIVKSIAAHLDLFEASFGTSMEGNLRGVNKLAKIKEFCKEKSFSYIGDSRADIPIWNESKRVFVVANVSGFTKEVQKSYSDVTVLPRNSKGISAYVKLLRPHQWTKNFLILIPLFLAHKISDVDKVISCVKAFVVFSLAASSLYIVNDFFDLESDRKHPKKRFRPLAAGDISLIGGVVLSDLAFIVSIAMGLFTMRIEFLYITLLYAIASLIYSLFLKSRIVIDVLGLSALYSLRIFAGGVAAEVPVSPWLLAFSTFFFLSLALLKRFIDLEHYSHTDKSKLDGRGYTVSDMPLVQICGIASGFISVLVFFLYITNSNEAVALYSQPMYLWAIGPFLIYWLTRIWFLANREMVDSDPVLFAVKDVTSWAVGGIITLLVVLGSIF